MTEENLHKAHRLRLKERFLQQGLDGFEDHLVLELILFYAIPRIDVNGLAHELLNRFGSLHGVLDASVDDLRKVRGVGENAALLIKLIPQLSRRYLISQQAKRDVALNDSAQAGRYLMPFFRSERDEVVYVLCMNSKNRVLCCRQMFRGDLNSAQVSVRKIVELVIRENATSVILAHNHTGGSPEPSKEDILLTEDIAKALKAVDIALRDHIIVSGSDYISLYQSGLIKQF
jgi:DNA repair protein RadC